VVKIALTLNLLKVCAMLTRCAEFKFTIAGLNAGMAKTRSSLLVAAVCLLYLASAVLTCVFARAHSGVAVIWVPTAMLAAWLHGSERAQWPVTLGGCAIANELAAGWFGAGWLAGLGLTFANMAEAVAAALLARHVLRAFWPRATFELVSIFLLGTLLVIPAGGALIAAISVHLAHGVALGEVFHDWMLGHAVGLVAILPWALTMAIGAETRARAQGRRRRQSDAASPARRHLISGLMVATMALLTVCVFAQGAGWPLAAPLLFALFAAVWGEQAIATAMPVLVALIAAPMTAAGFGPFASDLVRAPDRLQLGLLYVGLVACCCLPVIVEQARRRREVARLARSAAHFQALSQRADSLIDELRRDALTDSLTGLPNRRAFDAALTQQALAGQGACVAIIDIDHFKRVNDRLGHGAGDAVLVRFAEIARGSFRGGDMVGRIGGEEFGVILRGVGVEQACRICQRLTDRLASEDIETPFGTVRVTISTGIAAIGRDGDASLVSADSALYEAKRGGRSRLSAVA
jgi:diguanylate cyclase (GGDEF)-like protein